MRRLFAKPRVLRWVALFGICWGLSPLIFRLADLERGYDATGGEALIPLIPVIVLILAIARHKTID